MNSGIQSFNPDLNLIDGIAQWQRNKATRFLFLLNSKNKFYGTYFSNFWRDWIETVFTLATVDDFGATVWSIILNISLSISSDPDAPNKPLFGFGSETGTPNTYLNFEHGNFVSSGTSFFPTLAEKIFILQMRYFQTYSKGTQFDANRIFSIIFPAAGYEGEMYLTDDPANVMNAILWFSVEPGSRLRFILDNYDIMPIPAGVGYSIQIV